MFRTVLTLQSSPADAQNLIEHYAKFEVMAEGIRQAGALECELCVSTDDPGDLLVISLWNSEADYQVWLGHPVRAQVTAEIRANMPRMAGKVYRIEDKVTRVTLGLE